MVFQFGKKGAAMRGQGSTKWVVSTLSAALGLGSVVAAAQTVPDPSGGEVDEIIVTAQRRTENLQKSSIVVDVISSEALEKAGVTQVQDLTSIAPGMQV